MNKRRGIFLISCLCILLFVINYNFLDSSLENFLEESQTVIVNRIIDGDTIVVENDTHVRMLGINTPEKKENYHDEAMKFLNKLLLNKTVRLEYGQDKIDKYERTLAFVFLDGKNINIEQVRNGFANVYILDDKEYEIELRNAWKECIQSNKNLCEKSKDECANCIELTELNVKEQKVILANKCSFECDLTNWEIKDEGRKKFIFEKFILEENKEVEILVGNKTNTKEILFWNEKDYVWTATGDTIFLRDSDDKLVFWEKV